MDIGELRLELDAVNRRLLAVAAERFALIDEVARWKQANGVPILDEPREIEAKTRTEERALELGLPPGFGVALAELLIEFAKQREAELMAGARS
jgi:chorismate mutase